jgi:hypothetical protein
VDGPSFLARVLKSSQAALEGSARVANKEEIIKNKEI